MALVKAIDARDFRRAFGSVRRFGVTPALGACEHRRGEFRVLVRRDKLIFSARDGGEDGGEMRRRLEEILVMFKTELRQVALEDKERVNWVEHTRTRWQRCLLPVAAQKL